MNSNQRTEFDSLLERLYGGFNMPISDARKEAYWQGLSKMSLGLFSQCVDHALGENGPERIPSSSAIWKLSKTLRAPAPRAPQPSLESQSEGLRIVNGLFLKYIERRRLKEGFKGDIDMPSRRAACLSLVSWISDWNQDELKTEFAQIKTLFNTAMERVPDANQT